MARAGTFVAACLAIFDRAALAARVNSEFTTCMHPCEASEVTVGGKLFTIGNKVDFQTQGKCLGKCEVVVAGWLGHTGCEERLEGSIKVAKTRKRKLCCQVHQCIQSQEPPSPAPAPPVTRTTEETVPSTTAEEVPVVSTGGKKTNGEASVEEDSSVDEDPSVQEQEVEEAQVQTDAPADMVKAFGTSLADRLYKVFDSIDELEGFTIGEMEDYMGETLSAKDRARLAERGIN
eukprot:TRINITY_DN6398_c0_g1_i2.p1 TRINITY_DN6398_c0_g1~~TRINITY_DN6398_c0_g1_i2.p1  ORF type:complete len:262 (+),score=52.39 TRINITY_DN6398_c0_g1_i2:88-786(+)